MVRIKKTRKTFVLCVVMVVLLNFIGVGYSLWATNINVNSYIESGNVEVVYDNCSIVSETPEEGLADVKINGSDNSEKHGKGKNNKKLDIKIKKAFPGYSTTIIYTVKNIGTLPLNCTPVDDINSPVNISIEPLENIYPPPYRSLDSKLLDDNMMEYNSKSGIITISIGDDIENQNYTYSLPLVFSNNNTWDDTLEVSISIMGEKKLLDVNKKDTVTMTPAKPVDESSSESNMSSNEIKK